jgi:hypothetical protein
MSGRTKYGDVALGVEAALPAPFPEFQPGHGLTRLRRTLTWLYAALKRWA